MEPMKTIDVADATASLAEYTLELTDEPLVILSQGAPVAVLVAVRGSDLESVSLSLNPKFIEIIERSRAQAAAGQSIPMEEMWRRLGLDQDSPSTARKPRGKLAAPSKRGRQKS
jgi:PHD/YefM family antitoxin component YafN of YafNO toxin-antitoxin module